jgi:hypothetical protein
MCYNKLTVAAMFFLGEVYCLRLAEAEESAFAIGCEDVLAFTFTIFPFRFIINGTSFFTF